MGDTITFDPAAMRDVADDVDLHGGRLRDVGADLAAALRAYEASGSEFVVATPAHGARLSDIAHVVGDIADTVRQLADAAAEAERRGLDLGRVRDALGPVATASGAAGAHDAVVRLLRTTIHGSRELQATARLLRLDRVYGPRPMPDIAAVRRSVPGGAGMARRQVRRLQLDTYRELKRTRRTVRGARDLARTRLRSNVPLTRVGHRVDDFMATTRTGSVLRVGSRALGVAGVGLGIHDTMSAYAAGDTEGAVVSGLSTVGGALLMTGNPVTAGAGAVLVAGVVVHENWDTVTDLADRTVDAVGRGLESAGEALADVGGSVVDGAASLVGGLF